MKLKDLSQIQRAMVAGYFYRVAEEKTGRPPTPKEWEDGLYGKFLEAPFDDEDEQQQFLKTFQEWFQMDYLTLNME